ncbi:MAG TPA: hypothetical protein VGZ90_13630 [Puia sp.]|jgi:hypothetical protein|nr:hypothetical protein [Puia sp.]
MSKRDLQFNILVKYQKPMGGPGLGYGDEKFETSFKAETLKEATTYLNNFINTNAEIETCVVTEVLITNEYFKKEMETSRELIYLDFANIRELQEFIYENNITGGSVSWNNKRVYIFYWQSINQHKLIHN